MNNLHKCSYDKIKVVNDEIIWIDSKKGPVAQKVNYCPICGWTKAIASLMEQNIKDGI